MLDIFACNNSLHKLSQWAIYVYFLLALTFMLMLMLLSDEAAGNARVLECKGCPIPIATNATNATISQSPIASVCNTMVAFRALINVKEREGERRSPHPGKNAIFIATLQTMVVVSWPICCTLAPPLDSFRIDHPCSMHLHRAMIAGGWWGQPSMFIDYHPMSWWKLHWI